MAGDQEVAANAEKFRQSVSGAITSNIDEIVKRDGKLLDEAYARLTTLQSWRSFVLDQRISKEALGFFAEAQNDGITSSILITSGLWRSSLKSLRSLIENLVQSAYFMDHPVEYRRWHDGKLRPTFADLFKYLAEHPDICNLPEALNPVADLKAHYRHLSNVVHSSSLEFRMTDDVDELVLWKTSAADIGNWSTTHKRVLRSANQLYLALFSIHLQGAANKGLRESLAIVLPSSQDELIKSKMSVNILR
ncbi:hypothetical protein GS624_01100 [Ruegeria sp. HKCCD5849]|uniref:hypothetical protein n=1 Tax=unclassified Ruegeria TaxID=2625375 RepID=UPI00149230C2|nr:MULTISPECIES: hypothetical protein [unclassified Ruegeria]NOD45901.1 hypothetical protein [Ruegeria sp. HKCCD5849]NOD50799.1 hypothetical protein [Ruegeria sp. HKCCD5851]